MYSAWGYLYRIAVTQAASDTLQVIERTLPTEPISDEEWGRSGFHRLAWHSVRNASAATTPTIATTIRGD